MTMPDPSTTRVSSPTSTGGGGTFFEQHVDAAFLSLLLIRGIPPILTNCQVCEVHLQTEHRGWNTDDLLVVGRTGAGDTRQMAVQVKSRFVVSHKDEECCKVFGDFWRDFQAGSVFQRGRDCFALIILQITNTLSGNLIPLLDSARSAINASDFFRRLSATGYLSKKAQDYCQEIRAIIETAHGSAVSDEEFWKFLQHIHLLSYDLNTSTSQTEASLKTLLAHTAVGLDQQGVANRTWAELLRLVGSGMPHAASFTYDQLPEDLRHSHTPVGVTHHSALSILSDHTLTTLRTIRATVGPTFHLSRDQLNSQLIELLESSRTVIVTGPAGSGKSAIAKEVFEHLDADHLAFAFRAEEFATAHLDQTLQQSHVPLNAENLFSLLAGQSRKLLLIESIERLLEASVRDAFADLLALVSKDPTWRIILTCRDYSLDIVQSSFLQHAGLSHSVLPVPALSDDELDAVVTAIPILARPVTNPRLRTVLRNPYILDKAAWMPWPDDAPLPQDERSFRDKFWHDVIREDAESADGYPRRREQAFVQVALRRARALVPFVSCVDLDQPAIDRLHHRGLLSYTEQTDTLAAPAHDVLEDWALLAWIDQLFASHNTQPSTFAQELGTYPAVRRAYRKWLGESLECAPQVVDEFALTVVNDSTLPAQFRDDTLVCLLLSPTAGEFIARNETTLLTQNVSLLRRIIHLLRVACKKSPPWLSANEVLSSVFLLPHGPAWSAVLAVVHRHLLQLLPADIGLLLGLVDDWSRGVAWWSPLPAGASDAVAIAHALLSHLDYYNSEDDLKRVLVVIAKIPRADEASFLALIQRACTNNREDHIAEVFADILLKEFNGSAACRDVPDAMIQLAEARFCLSSVDELRDDLYFADIDMEPRFGLRPHLDFDFCPPSAVRGPFFLLLQHHPQRAVDFIIRLLNHSTEWYARYPDPRGFVEPPWQVTLRLPDGTTVRQWINPRLWLLYRSKSVGPYVLQCALMALEQWLLALCESHPKVVEQWLLYIIRTSTSGATTAVVAGIATAHSAIAGIAALPLLACRDIVQIDRGRMAQETFGGVWSGIPTLQAEHRIYIEERKKADALPHRRTDLEAVALNLHLGPHVERVREILDAHHNDLPPIDNQTEDDRLWRLALHRMDLRKYTAEPQPEEPQPSIGNENPPESSEGGSPQTTKILLNLVPPDADIQAIIDRDSPAHADWERRMSLAFWARAVFQGDREAFADPQQWKDRLRQAREIKVDTTSDAGMLEGHLLVDGPVFVAAIAVRDHWEELSADDRTWCFGSLANTIKRDCDTDNELLIVSRGGFDGACPAAYCIPLILTKELVPADRIQAIHLLSLALTHAIREVTLYAAEGIGRHLWPTNPDLAISSVGALASQANALDALLQQEPRRRFSESSRPPDWQRNTIVRTRSSFPLPRAEAERALSQLDFMRLYASWTLTHILPILRRAPAQPLAQQFFSRIASAVSDWWRSSHSHNNRAADRRPIELEHACLDHLCHFVLEVPQEDAIAICQPLIDAVESEPREAADFIRDLIIVEDQVGTRVNFWALWQAIADRIVTARWLGHLDSGHSSGTEPVRYIFLGGHWKDDVRHWHSLEGYSDRVDALYERLPPCATVLEAYLSFLYHIGEHSLPNAFMVIDRSLRKGSSCAMLGDSNTRFYLESLLQRFVYSNPARLKSNLDLRNAVLHLLDELVESGSSVAYRMRDDFVTPTPS